MGLIIDAVTGENLWEQVRDNLKYSRFVDARGKVISDFVEEVLREVDSSAIDDLRIWGHGYLDRPDGVLRFSSDVVDFNAIDRFQPHLVRLTPKFARGARAELRGCAVAKGTGQALMQRLAEIWKVNVDAADSAQSSVLFWEGTVWRATPGGGKPRKIQPYNTNAR